MRPELDLSRIGAPEKLVLLALCAVVLLLVLVGLSVEPA